MTYSVKTIYPEFKCLTIFRKVMKGLGKVIREEWYDGRAVKWWSGSVFKKKVRYVKYNGKDKKQKFFIWYGVLDKLDKSLDERFLKMKKDTRYMNRFETMNCYDEIGEKHTKILKNEFYVAMISRDYKAVTLCDDVIGLVFEYL